MEIRAGTDLIEITRIREAIERHGDRFLQRIFTRNELAEVGRNFASLAARFAAKEAVSKALGTGIGPVGWHDIEILRGESRQPILSLHNSAERIATTIGLSHWSVSLSHTETMAIAVVVAIGE